MTNSLNTAGYLTVHLSRPGLRKIARVHRLVAQAFIENPLGLPEVNHLDGNRANPVVGNLEWCTSSENRVHAFHVLKSIHMPHNGKLTFDLAQQMRSEHIPGVYGCKRLARKYGVVPKLGARHSQRPRIRRPTLLGVADGDAVGGKSGGQS